jgi:hypothetical protein
MYYSGLPQPFGGGRVNIVLSAYNNILEKIRETPTRSNPSCLRTGANSTDNCVSGVILQDIYKRQYTVPAELKPQTMEV